MAAVAGYPSVTVPATQFFGLPVGLSFVGRPWSEPLLLALAADFEAATKAYYDQQIKAINARYTFFPFTRVVGFLSMRDLMNFALEQKTEELHHMRAYIHGST